MLAFGIGVMINRDSRGHSYFIVRAYKVPLGDAYNYVIKVTTHIGEHCKTSLGVEGIVVAVYVAAQLLQLHSTEQ